MIFSNALEAAFGGGLFFGPQTATTVQIPIGPRVININPQNTSVRAKLPDATTIQNYGMFQYVVWNSSPSRSLPIDDWGSTERIILAPNEMTAIHLKSNADANNGWIFPGLGAVTVDNEDWFVQIGSRYWQMLSDFTMPVQTAAGPTRFAPLTPQSEPLTGKLSIDTIDDADQDVNLVQS